MVNITSKDLVLLLYIPLNGFALGDTLALDAISTHDSGDRLDFTIQGWEVVGTFVKVCAERPAGMHPGEWEYRLVAGETLVSQGLMMIPPEGSFAQVKEYNKQTDYKEYGN